MRLARSAFTRTAYTTTKFANPDITIGVDGKECVPALNGAKHLFNNDKLVRYSRHREGSTESLYAGPSTIPRQKRR